MAGETSIYGRKTVLDDIMDATGSAVKRAVPASRRALKLAGTGAATAYSNTLGNTGVGGSGAPTYVDDPYAIETPAVATAAPPVPAPVVKPPVLAGSGDAASQGADSPINVADRAKAPPLAAVPAVPAAPSPSIAATPQSGLVKNADGSVSAANPQSIESGQSEAARMAQVNQQSTQAAQAESAQARQERLANMDKKIADNLQEQNFAAAEAVRPWWAGGTKETSAAGQLRLAALQGQGKQLAELSRETNNLEGTMYHADAGVKSQQIASDAGLASTRMKGATDVDVAKIGSEGKMAAALANQANEQLKLAGAQKKEEDKSFQDRVNQHFKNWEGLNLPPQYRQNLQKFAALQADSEDTKGKTFIVASPRPGMAGIAVPRSYQKVYDELLKTMPHADAAARINALASKNGVAQEMPDLYQYPTLTTARKNAASEVL